MKAMEQKPVKSVIRKIDTLMDALQYFRDTFYKENEANPRFRGFEVIDRIKTNSTMDYSKSSSKRINKSMDETGRVEADLVEREKERTNTFRTQRDDTKNWTTCWVVRVAYVSPLQIRDYNYYYVVFRKKLYYRWANNLYESAKKYFNTNGITLDTSILLHSIRNPLVNTDVSSVSTLVLVMGDGSESIYYMNMDKINRLAAKGLGVVTDKWNQQVIGIPITEFSENRDINDYS